jgi:hypothetical protein
VLEFLQAVLSGLFVPAQSSQAVVFWEPVEHNTKPATKCTQ